MLLEKNTLFGPPLDWFTGCNAVSLGQRPFCASASISVPGAPASSLATDSQVDVLKPGVEIWAPDWFAVALLTTFQPLPPRFAMSLAPVSAGEASAAADLAAGPVRAGPPAAPAAWRGCGPAVDPAAAVAEAATSDAAPTNAVTQNAELRRTAIPIAGDLSATRHDRPPPLSRWWTALRTCF